MIEVLNKVIDSTVRQFSAEYVEIRSQELFKTMLTVKEGRVEGAKQGIENGAAIRVLVNGAWGFASVGNTEYDALSKAASDACRMAKTASEKLKNPIKLAPTTPIQDKVLSDPKKDPREVPIQDKIALTLELSKQILEADNRMKGCTINYFDMTGTSYFANNEHTQIEQSKLYVWTGISATASEANVFTFSRGEIGSTAGYEIFDVETPEKVGQNVARRAVDQLKAKPPKGGNYPAVLGPNIVGVFAHEAFGHLAEADLTLSGSVLMDKMGKKVGSDLVSIYDDGTVKGAFGSFKYDDEGVPAKKTLLVKDGIVKGLMHNRETAYKFNAAPTGNARAEDFHVDPIIRMRNTFIEPRDRKLEELLEGVKFGYYLKAFRGGQANYDGTFQVGVQEGYEIINGEIHEPVRNASISGNTLETLFEIDAVGKDFELSPGRCGKGQEAFVCDGGPHIRVKEVQIGGST